jgi:hypothetical protein
MNAVYAIPLSGVKPPACAPEGWQPPTRGYDDEDPRPETRLERQARQVCRSMRERQGRS